MPEVASAGGIPTHQEIGRRTGGGAVPIAALVAAVLGGVTLLLPPGQVKLALLVLFAVSGPGCAVVAQLWPLDSFLYLPLILVGSLAISAALPTLMLWAHWWHPDIELTALVVGCALSGCVALRRRRTP